MLRKLIALLQLGVPQEPHLKEIYFLRRNLARDRALLEELRDKWPVGACCPNCYYGSSYTELQDKQERREKRLRFLMRKRP